MVTDLQLVLYLCERLNKALVHCWQRSLCSLSLLATMTVLFIRNCTYIYVSQTAYHVQDNASSSMHVPEHMHDDVRVLLGMVKSMLSHQILGS